MIKLLHLMAFADNTQRSVASSDGNFYKDSVSYITIELHLGSDGQRI